jgi:hypothetical protein
VAAFALGAMEIKVTGHQLFLSGPVIGDEFDKVQKILADDPAIDTQSCAIPPAVTRQPAIASANCSAPRGCALRSQAIAIRPGPWAHTSILPRSFEAAGLTKR